MILLDDRSGSGELLPLSPAGTAQLGRLQYGDASFEQNDLSHYARHLFEGYTVTDWWARSVGYSFGNAHTTISDGTTTVATLLHEGLANGVVLRPAAATGNAVSTNMLTALAENKPIKIVSDALETTGHTIELCVDYIVSTIEETA